jgi:hypothetical protein
MQFDNIGSGLDPYYACSRWKTPLLSEMFRLAPWFLSFHLLLRWPIFLGNPSMVIRSSCAKGLLPHRAGEPWYVCSFGRAAKRTERRLSENPNSTLNARFESKSFQTTRLRQRSASAFARRKAACPESTTFRSFRIENNAMSASDPLSANQRLAPTLKVFVKPKLANETMVASESRTRFDFIMCSFVPLSDDVL